MASKEWGLSKEIQADFVKNATGVLLSTLEYYDGTRSQSDDLEMPIELVLSLKCSNSYLLWD